MKRLRAALILALASVPAGAQGRLVPRPCVQPIPPCREGRCPEVPLRPCIAGNAIVRTSSSVRVEMANRVLRYEVSETFLNTGGGLGEADYLFPLPAGSAFEDLKLSINGELVSGETMGAAEARRIYEDIVRRQRDPALVEWMGSGLLRARIFPINPGEEKRVVVRFQAVAQREGDALRIDYVRGSDPSPRPGITPIVREQVRRDDVDDIESPNDFAFTYEDLRDYGTPYSPTNRLTIRDRGTRKTVHAAGDAREVTILLPLRRTSAASVSVLTHRPNTDPGFALITISPPASNGRATQRDVTFVIDVSGSMRGAKLDQAKAAGQALLATLGRGDRFRLIDFSTDVHTFREGFLAASPENIHAAERYLEDLRAEGSTNISGALEVALDARYERGRLPLIVFLTDGEPTVGKTVDMNEIRREVLRVNAFRGVQIHVIFVGEQGGEDLQKLAHENRGVFVKIGG